MKEFIALNESLQSVFAVWYGVLMLSSMFLALRLLLRRSFLPVPGLVLLFAAEYLALQCMFMMNSYLQNGDELDRFAGTLAEMPWLAVAGIAAALTVFQSAAVRRAKRWSETHVTGHSIKEGLDALPMGICWYRESGYIAMKNSAMERLYGSIAGRELLDGNELREALVSASRASLPGEDRDMLVTAEGPSGMTCWSVSMREFRDGDVLYKEILAADVTEEYEQTRKLTEKKRELEELNERLSRYSREIVDTITAQEILSARVRIHDDLGQLLLASRRYLLRGGNGEERERLTELFRTNLRLMDRGQNENRRGHLDMLREAASDMGIRLIIEGDMPEDEKRRQILITAVHENLTNTIRHARGDVLMVRLQPGTSEGSVLAVFGNNGEAPGGEIEEKGGLKSLRRLVEEAGGSMRIVTGARFRMEIEI